MIEKIFKVRYLPQELEEELREKTVHLVDNTNTKRPIFPKDKVEITKEDGSGWNTVKVIK